jgi:hypothetical protein
MLSDMRPGPRRQAVRTIVFVAANVASLVALFPTAFIVGYFVTLVITGWRDPGPDIVQGCDKNLTCAEGAVFFPALAVLAVVFLVVIVAIDVVVLRSWHQGRRTPSPLRWVRRQFEGEVSSSRQLRASRGGDRRLE